ncbi:MAG: hypothetical protein DCF25_13880 [Leptolyngbya foveolarum]|uniref:DUF6883 domain-containing protein n=1 Tax=Leptolyngbya foveolarum TaxID=47253 RepID=A0A2W4UEM6_9CYAN|nr:MAG: hypothetical protein DCF25_13880 [Leptolyngbya foveolarum]
MRGENGYLSYVDELEAIAPNRYGQRYQAVVIIMGPSGKSYCLRTVWIVLTGETITRFVTAVLKKIMEVVKRGPVQSFRFGEAKGRDSCRGWRYCT